MAQITINEGLAWLKTLKTRHEELLALRNDNAHRIRLLEQALKATNARTLVEAYDQDDAVLGELT